MQARCPLRMGNAGKETFGHTASRQLAYN
jgi:hypothetical protein